MSHKKRSQTFICRMISLKLTCAWFLYSFECNGRQFVDVAHVCQKMKIFWSTKIFHKKSRSFNNFTVNACRSVSRFSSVVIVIDSNFFIYLCCERKHVANSLCNCPCHCTMVMEAKLVSCEMFITSFGPDVCVFVCETFWLQFVVDHVNQIVYAPRTKWRIFD